MKVFAVKDSGDAENPASYRLYGNTVILLSSHSWHPIIIKLCWSSRACREIASVLTTDPIGIFMLIILRCATRDLNLVVNSTFVSFHGMIYCVSLSLSFYRIFFFLVFLSSREDKTGWTIFIAEDRSTKRVIRVYICITKTANYVPREEKFKTATLCPQENSLIAARK